MNTKVKEFFSQNDIKYVLFDMDSTLVDTSTYFTTQMLKVIKECVDIILPNLQSEKRDGIAEEIREICRSIHKASNNPIIVYELTYLGIIQYIDVNNIEYAHKKELSSFIKQSFSNFYLQSPELFPDTLSSLHKIHSIGIPMYVYSHAQVKWTKIKVERIEKEYRDKYKQDINLPFFTTEITDVKDAKGWEDAARYHNLDIKQTLVVGDSFTSDILPAIETGYINLIYLSNNKDTLDIDKDINLKIVDGIGDIFNTV